VLAGVEEVARLLEGKPVTVKVMREGTIFKEDEPVLLVEGRYSDFAVMETAILGLLCQASGVATRASRCRKAAGEKLLVSFGARRMHPGLAPMIERSAFIGGFDGVAVIKSAELIGEKPVGTMPHSLILIAGDSVKAFKLFDEVIDKDVRRVALIDTFVDEKFEAVRLAEEMGDRLYGVRLDTPGSRKGNMRHILDEVRWELDLRGYKDVKLYLSGGLDEYQIMQYNDLVDAYGVGTSLSNAPVINFAMDIVEIDGSPIAKRGKKSGVKDVWRCTKCFSDIVLPEKDSAPRCGCGKKMERLYVRLIENGKIAYRLPSPQEIRKYVLEQLKKIIL
jgi:nicotinate phosphoribosyltransferase